MEQESGKRVLPAAGHVQNHVPYLFLARGRLHWSHGDVMAMPAHVRRRFVEMLETRLEYERKRMKRKSG